MSIPLIITSFFDETVKQALLDNNFDATDFHIEVRKDSVALFYKHTLAVYLQKDSESFSIREIDAFYQTARGRIVKYAQANMRKKYSDIKTVFDLKTLGLF